MDFRFLPEGKRPGTKWEATPTNGQRRRFYEKWMLFLSVYFMLCLLASCGAAADGGTVSGGIPPEQEQAAGGTARPAAAIMTCRVVEEQSGGLLLAEADGGTWAVYAADAAEKLWVNGKSFGCPSRGLTRTCRRDIGGRAGGGGL